MNGPDENTVDRVAKAIRDQNRRHMQMSNPSLTFDRDTLTADELNLARAAIAAMPDTTAKARNDELREAARRANRIAYLLTLAPQSQSWRQPAQSQRQTKQQKENDR